MKTGKPEPMVLAIAKDEMEFSVLEEANDWIEALASETPAGAVSFAAFYSRLQTQAPLKSLDALLPRIPESVNSHAVVRHCMMQVKKITNTLNPQQRPVITADQPVYALCKQVQLMCPKEFGAFFCKMGDLHIEMAFMSVIGDWLEGSGWRDVYSLSGISTPGRIDSFLKSSHVKRTRYAHQVTLSVLLQLQRSALQCSEQSTYEEWKSKKMDDSVTALYWFTVIDLIVMLFMSVRSLRESNFRFADS